MVQVGDRNTVEHSASLKGMWGNGTAIQTSVSRENVLAMTGMFHICTVQYGNQDLHLLLST